MLNIHCHEIFSTKEYMLVRERTASPASSNHLPTQPLPMPALSDSQGVGVYCRQSKERLGGQMFGRHRWVLSVLLLIYILCSPPTGFPNSLQNFFLQIGRLCNVTFVTYMNTLFIDLYFKKANRHSIKGTWRVIF